MGKCTRKIQYVKEEPESGWSVLEQIARKEYCNKQIN